MCIRVHISFPWSFGVALDVSILSYLLNHMLQCDEILHALNKTLYPALKSLRCLFDAPRLSR